MPRTKRKLSYTKVYHVIMRGIDKQDIFLTDNDRLKFLKVLDEEKTKYVYQIYAYCLMTNHIHMIIYDKEEKLSKLMQSIGIRYSMYFNKKYDRVGHLFQDRFFSRQVENREYIMQLCRYIHRNPEKAGIAKTEEYKWSSYKEYIDVKGTKHIYSKMILSIFSEDKELAKKEFIKFHSIDDEYEKSYKYNFENEKNDKQFVKIICNIFKLEDVRDINKLNTKERDKVISKCKNISGITNRQIARILGLNRKIIDRARENQK